MTRTSAAQSVGQDDLLRLHEPVRRYLSRSVTDTDELDDLVQETLARVWEVRRRVDRQVAASYAVATARNLVQSRRRADEVHDRHAHRLYELPTVEGPEQVALRQEERRAVAEALARLPEDDRQLLTRAYGDEQDGDGERSARVRSRLARARARARVDYLLRLRRLELPTSACRPVLEALSSGDRREQERTGAADHLLSCRTCSSCAPALLARARGLFGVVAVPLLALWELVRHAPRTTAVTTGTVAAVVAAVLVGTAVGQHEPASPSASARPAAAPAAAAPAPTPAGPVVLDGTSGFDVAPAGAVGRAVQASGVPVLAVVSDEGFWVGPQAGGRRLFVLLGTGDGGAGESGVDVRVGDRVSFTGTVRALVPAATAGVSGPEGLAELRQDGAYLDVPASAVALR